MGALDRSAARGAARTDRRAAIALFLLLFGLYALWAGGHPYSSDEEGYFQQALAFSRGDYAIEYTEDNARVTASRPGRDGRPVGAANIGAPLAAVPLALAGRGLAQLAPAEERGVMERLGVGFTNAWITALTAAVVFLLARELGAPRRAALLLALVFGVGTMAWPYAGTLLFSEPLAALLVSAGVLFAVRAGTRRPLLWAPLAGLAVGASVLARASTLPFAALVGLYLAFVLVRRRGIVTTLPALAGYGAGVASALGLVALTNWWRYGSSVETGYGDVPFDGSFWTGLYGLLLSPGKSLFLYAPVALLALVGLPFAVRRRPAETLLMLGIVAVNIGIFARFPQWHGDQAWGPRYLVIILPLAVALCAPLLADVRWRRALVVAGVVGVGSGLVGSVMYTNQYFFIAQQRFASETPTGTSPDDLFRPLRFEPQWSPILWHVRLLNDVAHNSALRLDGDDPSFRLYGNFPQATTSRYFWYFAPPQLDTWWYWSFPQGTSKRVLLLVPLLVGCVALGARGVRRAAAGEEEAPAPAARAQSARTA